jgi:hypothetical protein
VYESVLPPQGLFQPIYTVLQRKRKVDRRQTVGGSRVARRVGPRKGTYDLDDMNGPIELNHNGNWGIEEEWKTRSREDDREGGTVGYW